MSLASRPSKNHIVPMAIFTSDPLPRPVKSLDPIADQVWRRLSLPRAIRCMPPWRQRAGPSGSGETFLCTVAPTCCCAFGSASTPAETPSSIPSSRDRQYVLRGAHGSPSRGGHRGVGCPRHTPRAPDPTRALVKVGHTRKSIEVRWEPWGVVGVISPRNYPAPRGPAHLPGTRGGKRCGHQAVGVRSEPRRGAGRSDPGCWSAAGPRPARPGRRKSGSRFHRTPTPTASSRRAARRRDGGWRASAPSDSSRARSSRGQRRRNRVGRRGPDGRRRGDRLGPVHQRRANLRGAESRFRERGIYDRFVTERALASA